MYIAASVIVLAFTFFRPLTVGLIRAAVLVVRPRQPKPRLSLMAKVNTMVAGAAPAESAFAVEPLRTK